MYTWDQGDGRHLQ